MDRPTLTAQIAGNAPPIVNEIAIFGALQSAVVALLGAS
jgi:hypothetical protein